MDTSNWIALASVIVAFVFGVVTVFALKYGRRSAAEARRSADHAGDAVVEARRAADEAARMREIDEDRRREERERWHRESEPDLPGEIDAEYRPSGGHGSGDGSLHGSITVHRVYRVQAEAVSGRSRHQLAIATLTRPHQPIDFMIERWPQGKSTIDTEEIVFRFWPPIEGADGAGLWACECGRPGGGSLAGDGHWERRVKVSYQRMNGPRFL